jgi:hypothetical protein
VDCNSVANPSQAEAAASIGPDPGPAYIRAELISGGKPPKSIMKLSLAQSAAAALAASVAAYDPPLVASVLTNNS